MLAGGGTRSSLLSASRPQSPPRYEGHLSAALHQWPSPECRPRYVPRAPGRGERGGEEEGGGYDFIYWWKTPGYQEGGA